jgi:hypothetical protein
MPKALHELIAQADEFAARFEAYEPRQEDRDTVNPVTALHLAALRRAEAERELAAAIERARQSKVAWRVIGDAVGTTGESARQRYGAAEVVASANAEETTADPAAPRDQGPRQVRITRKRRQPPPE